MGVLSFSQGSAVRSGFSPSVAEGLRLAQAEVIARELADDDPQFQRWGALSATWPGRLWRRLSASAARQRALL